jgi:CheY-like chemotaxis protein
MRVLIADDDSLCRKVLTTLLERAHHEVVPFQEGASALTALLAPDPPPVAILDWMMPGYTGVELCTRLRAANLKVRPYVIMHSVRGRKEDIIAGLDAGADDYLPKPVNSAELLARLRAAERITHYQRELSRRVAELQGLVQRYQLLGEMAGRQSARAGAASTPAVVKSADEQTLPELSEREIDGIVVRTLSELGLGEAEVKSAPMLQPEQPALLTAWAGLILVKDQIWVDLLLEASDAEVAKICERTLRRQPGHEEGRPEVLAETHTILSGALKAAIQAKGGRVLAPLLSRVRFNDTTEPVPPLDTSRRSHLFSFGDCSLRLTVVPSRCAPRRKGPEQLHPLDVLAEPLFLPEMPDVPLFNQGALLNEHYIERLASLGAGRKGELTVPVFEPSGLAEFFCD